MSGTEITVEWVVQTIKDFTNQRVSDLEKRFDDRLKEADLRYQQRFDASQKALEAASLAAEKAVAAALAAAKEAVGAASVSAEKLVAAALASAEKAIEKAEAAQHAHNALTNEWRATVNDVTKTVADNARHESEVRVEALKTNTELAIKGLQEKVDVALRIGDRTETRDSTKADGMTTTIAVASVVAAFAAVGAAIIVSRPSTPLVPTTPQVVYLPAPAAAGAIVASPKP